MKDTERLYYRLIDKADFDFYYSINSNIKVMRYAYADAFQSEEEAKAAFKKAIDRQSDLGDGFQYIAAKKDTGEKIGIVDYEVIGNNQEEMVCEIGYFILPVFWGMGYAAEMGKEMVNHLFSESIANRAKASCHAENKASEKTMIKIGMKKDEINANGRFKDGKWADEICYSIRKDEWEIKKG
ncbi:MAG: GNAT family protein [Eubacteriales bacterium]